MRWDLTQIGNELEAENKIETEKVLDVLYFYDKEAVIKWLTQKLDKT